MLAELTVTGFQKVKNGDPVGQVLVTDPKILASSLSVVQAEIESLRISMQPMARQQHTAMEYTGLQLDWMRERAQLAMARVNLQLTETELQRIDALYKDKIVSQRAYEQAKASHDKCKSEVDELSQIVEQQAKEFNQSQLTNTIGLAQINDHRTGEAITAGEPIITIAAFNPIRIVGYIRAPVMSEPTVGTRVEVRSRGPGREVGIANIVEVGTQLETIAPALAPPVKFTAV